jgi:hypothetical protein
LFLVTGGVGTHANQASFWQHGVLNQVLQLAFNRATEMQIKAEVCTNSCFIRDFLIVEFVIGFDDLCGLDSGKCEYSRAICTAQGYFSA